MILKDSILALIQQNQARTQQEICDALLAQGFEISQTKVSRLLHKIGAVKIKDPQGRLTYHLAHEHGTPKKNSLIAEMVVDIATNQSLIVIQTQPGAASMISRLIDFHRKEMGILGTIAGDDTIFIAAQDTTKIAQGVRNLKSLLLEK